MIFLILQNIFSCYLTDCFSLKKLMKILFYLENHYSKPFQPCAELIIEQNDDVKKLT